MRIKIRKSDNIFSLYIRTRDGHKCQRCKKVYTPPYGASLQCSHFHRRGKENTRHDPLNAITLCFGCHRIWEGPTIEYRDFMLKKLGKKEFDKLQMRAETYKRRDDKLDVLYIQSLLDKIID